MEKERRQFLEGPPALLATRLGTLRKQRTRPRRAARSAGKERVVLAEQISQDEQVCHLAGVRELPGPPPGDHLGCVATQALSGAGLEAGDDLFPGQHQLIGAHHAAHLHPLSAGHVILPAAGDGDRRKPVEGEGEAGGHDEEGEGECQAGEDPFQDERIRSAPRIVEVHLGGARESGCLSWRFGEGVADLAGWCRSGRG